MNFHGVYYIRKKAGINRLSKAFLKCHRTKQKRLFIPQKWQECVFFSFFFEKVVDICRTGCYYTFELQLTGGENNMLMPIVSMNKMAMNESVATTCCYRQVATPTATYWEVLNGGWIGSGYVESWAENTKYAGMNASWRNSKYDVNLASTADLTSYRVAYLTADDATGAATNNSKGWYVYSVANPAEGAVTLNEWLLNRGNLITSKICEHNNTDCIYGKATIELKTNQHFESKSAHDTTSNWKNPHAAKQFSS